MTYFTRLLIASLTASILISCGGGSSSDDVTESEVSIGFSDFPVEGASKVVITVDTLTFISDGERIVVDRFSSDSLGISDADTFEIDLLQVQGEDYELVLDSVILPVGEYNDLRIGVLDEDTDLSYVEETEGAAVKELMVPSNEIKLGSFTVEARSTQTFVVEFDLRQAMTYNPGPDRYILKPRGVRVVSLVQAAVLTGNVDVLALSLDAACSEKEDPALGNMLYLYQGHDLNTANLGDVFDPDTATNVPTEIVSPYAVAGLSETGDFQIAFIEAGDYTLAYSCLAEDDAAETFDAISIPSPAGSIVELSFVDGEDSYCGFPLDAGACQGE